MPTDALKRPIEQFIEWEQANVSYWILSEARVAFPEKEYAGTMDAMAMILEQTFPIFLVKLLKFQESSLSV